ncbi:hypothetical protein BpHYR1_021456 [Brachionus plicatilis]|uniref:Uncharacterized protein n=1 Tax=Brachionus plicatilis TaxID=10195 RepID=A0A3M7RRZ1_BRAPC|nr:hypothetical protein BpHYR1_021456 [Brachionus plicatilis]
MYTRMGGRLNNCLTLTIKNNQENCTRQTNTIVPGKPRELYQDVPVYSVLLNQVRHDGEPSLFEDPSISEHQMTSICNFRFRKLLLDARKSGNWCNEFYLWILSSSYKISIYVYSKMRTNILSLVSARPLQLISSDISKNSIQGQLKFGLGRRPGLKSSVQQKELGLFF